MSVVICDSVVHLSHVVHMSAIPSTPPRPDARQLMDEHHWNRIGPIRSTSFLRS